MYVRTGTNTRHPFINTGKGRKMSYDEENNNRS